MVTDLSCPAATSGKGLVCGNKTSSRFGVEITDEDVELLLHRIHPDEDGNVRYLQFTAMFDLW